MNKMMLLAVCAAVLFFACSESPHTAGTTENENTVKIWASLDDRASQTAEVPSFRLGECLGDALLKGTIPEAYIVQDSAGNEQLMILKVSDYCGVGADLNYRRSGDTLTIGYGEIHEATACMCYSDHWFGLPAEYSNIKYFRFYGIVYEVDRGPAPEPSKPKEREPIDTPPAEYDPETGDSVVVIEL